VATIFGMWSRVGITALTAATVLTGCGRGATTATTTTETITVTATPTTTQAPVAAGPNPLGKEAGFRAPGIDQVVTVFGVNQDSAPAAPKPVSGGHWVGADVQLCVKQAPADQPVYASWSKWSVSDASFGNYEASSLTYSQFPTPKFPVSDPVAQNSCVRGWVLFPVGDEVVVTTVKYIPDTTSGASAVWSAA
jgi:hypothetical protein